MNTYLLDQRIFLFLLNSLLFLFLIVYSKRADNSLFFSLISISLFFIFGCSIVILTWNIVLLFFRPPTNRAEIFKTMRKAVTLIVSGVAKNRNKREMRNKKWKTIYSNCDLLISVKLRHSLNQRQSRLELLISFKFNVFDYSRNSWVVSFLYYYRIS